MDKLLIFPGQTDKGIFTYVIDTEKKHLEKTAAEYHPTIAAYINSAKPIRGKTQILLTALGAHEYWGVNANGDAFPEEALAHEGPDYGYKTFELHAKAYKHHVNKDPTAAYGDVPLAVYNPVFHRVELIVSLDNERAPDIVKRIEQGDYPDWSMGCKVPFDICSICGNKAPSRAYYCEHLKYYIGRIHPETGKMAYAINTRPKFFDISQVLIGADRIAKTLMKVASTARQAALPGSAYLAEKMAGVKKATIVKEVPADSPPASQENLENLGRLLDDVKSREEPLPRPLLDRLGGLPLPRVLSTMAMMGIAPRPQEFQRIYLISSGHRGLADDLDSRNLCFDPGWASSLDSSGADVSGVSYRNFDDLIMRMLCPFTAERSAAAPHLGRRLIIMSKTGGAVNKSPTYIKLSQEELRKKERKPFSPATVLLSAAALYAALQQKAPKEAAHGIDKLLQSPAGVGLAAALGLGLIKVFNSSFGAKAKGSYTSGRYENPDFNNASARIEEMKRKPYLKVAYAKSSPLVGSVGAAAKRLFIGVPLTYMGSGVLQEHRKINPYEREGRVKGFARRNPDLVSGLLVADALLALRGKGTHGVIRKFASADLATLGEDLLKQADAQDFFSNVVIMPLAMGPAGLPGRMVGGLFDQALVDAGKKILARRKERVSK